MARIFSEFRTRNVKLRKSTLFIYKRRPRSVPLPRAAAQKPDIRRQFSQRLKTLVDKKRVVQSRTVTKPKAPANLVALLEGFQQFDGDLNKLQVSSYAD